MQNFAKPLSNLPVLKIAGTTWALVAVVISAAYFFANSADNEPSTNYFPRQINESRQNWYGKNLTAFGEPKIYRKNDSKVHFIFRFTWLRTFHHPICVRLEHRKDGKTILYGKELNGAGGYEPGTLITNRKIELTTKQYEEFKNKLESVYYRQLSTEEENYGETDGARWIFELNESGRYHLVDRFCPDGSVEELGLWLLEAAKMTPDDHIY